MEYSAFSALVKKHFHYLVDEYGFTVAHESYHPETMGNAQVVFKSALVGIDIVCDRNDVLISLGLLPQGRRDWLEFANVVRVFAPDIGAVYNFPEDFSNREAALESQVSRLAQLMHQHCTPVLKGDFSAPDQARQAEHDRVTAWLEEMRKPTRKT
ncbi:MAG: hypothetical protein HYZ35_02975 [Chloroflexi bacterium]|nr:hypothetical protein [Chloroflexota bacterium]